MDNKIVYRVYLFINYLVVIEKKLNTGHINQLKPTERFYKPFTLEWLTVSSFYI